LLASDEVFSSRASIDEIFHSSNKDFDDFADLLLVGQEDGSVHLSIYDFFKVGSFEMRQSPIDVKTSRPILHSSHPFFSTHAILASSSSETNADLYFYPLDLRLIPETGRYLSLLAEKSTQLQNILRYMREAQVQIYDEFKNSQDLPRRFIRNIEEALQEQNQCDFVTAAYHTTVTGHCFPCMREWLVDELSERVK
jgi:anaphase-promoting complex subunit 4